MANGILEKKENLICQHHSKIENKLQDVDKKTSILEERFRATITTLENYIAKTDEVLKHMTEQNHELTTNLIRNISGVKEEIIHFINNSNNDLWCQVRDIKTEIAQNNIKNIQTLQNLENRVDEKISIAREEVRVTDKKISKIVWVGGGILIAIQVLQFIYSIWIKFPALKNALEQ